MQLRNTRLGRLPLPAAARQHKVFQIASLAQANGPSCALVPPGCCSLLQERMMIAQSAPAQWGRAGGGGGYDPPADLSPAGKVEWKWYENLQMLPTVLCTGGCVTILSHRGKIPSPSLT